MGQTVHAIVLGVVPKKSQERKLFIFEEDGGNTGELREGAPTFQLEYGTENEVLGIAVAVSNVPEESRGEVEMPTCVAVVDLEKVLSKRNPQPNGNQPLKEARKKWKEFSTWAKKQGVELAEPQLFLVQVERA